MIWGAVQIRMSSFLRIFLLCLFFGVLYSAESQILHLPSLFPFAERQEAGKNERARTNKPGDAKSIFNAAERLKRAVNGNSVVKNQCQFQGHTVQVEESTEIAEANGCNLVVKTVKTSSPGEGQRQLRFTMHANLADLSTPASVEPQNFSQCKPEQGTLLKVMSRAQPGKSIPTSRSSISQPSAGQTSSEDQEAPARKDLSFFFSDAAIARRAARALDRAVAICGGKDWPDEDDLP
jgi:hypothetical protein